MANGGRCTLNPLEKAGARLRGGLVLALLGVLAGCGSSVAPDVSSSSKAAAAACPFTPPADTALQSFCDKTSWVAGITELCGGHLVYRDYVYDDYGADHLLPALRFPLFPNTTNAIVVSAGDDTYPAGAENTADLIRFEMWPNGDQMQVRFQLNTLYDPNQTIGVVAIDTDDNAATGGGKWPGFDAGSQGWDEIHVFRDGDGDTNVISGQFPKPAGAAWKVWAAVAQADGTLMNVAFRGIDETATTGAWFEDKQAKALAAGDVTAFAAGVCPAEMIAGVTRGAALHPGFHERVYTSAYTVPPGEGISVAGVEGPEVNRLALDPRVYQSFNFLGRYQPYAYYLPDAPGPHGMQLLLHGFAEAHSSNINTPSVRQTFGDGLNRVLISPLGRGLAGGYSDISERDVLDALDDAQSFFDIDPAQVILSGVSMGGYGTLALGTQYPDRFAGIIGWVSPTGNFSVYPGGQPLTYIAGSLPVNTVPLVRNLRNLPTVLVYGALDEFVLATESSAMLTQLLAADPGVFDYFLYLDSDHLTTFGIDESREAALSAGWRRPAQVARVSYRYDPAYDVPAYNIKHDRAYWVSAIRARDDGYADVDLHSFGCGLPETTTQDGSNIGAGPAQYVYAYTFRHVSEETPTTAANRLEGELDNVASLRIADSGACLSGDPVSYQLQTDGPVTLTLDDGRSLTLPAAGSYNGSF